MRVMKSLLFGLSFLVIAPVSAADITVDVGRGPIHVNVPDSYDPATPMPLVMLLHGYSSTSEFQEAYMQFTPLSDSRGFIFVAPDGLEDSSGNQYWNGTDACCDFEGDTDDSGYLRSLIEEIQDNLNVDTKRIYVTGHSNGGYMSYRMACDHADLIAAIAPLAGMTWLDSTQCNPSEPVSVLHMHGTADLVVKYDGGCFDETCYPSAVESLNMWALYNGCNGNNRSGGSVNYVEGAIGNETIIRQNINGCPEGGALELWRMTGAFHVPNFTDDWNDAVIDFFEANPKR